MKAEPPFPKTPWSKTPFAAEMAEPPPSREIPVAVGGGALAATEQPSVTIFQRPTRQPVFSEEVSTGGMLVYPPGTRAPQAQYVPAASAVRPFTGTVQTPFEGSKVGTKPMSGTELGTKPMAGTELRSTPLEGTSLGQRQLQSQKMAERQMFQRPMESRTVPSETFPFPGFGGQPFKKAPAAKRMTPFVQKMPGRKSRITVMRDPLTALGESFRTRRAVLPPLPQTRAVRGAFSSRMFGTQSAGFLFGPEQARAAQRRRK